MTEKDTPICPHCNIRMKRWKIPPDSTWVEDFHWVCFNNDCSYYVKGWDWMLAKYKQVASYRHRFNPAQGTSGPLPVWSPGALKENIIRSPEEEHYE